MAESPNKAYTAASQQTATLLWERWCHGEGVPLEQLLSCGSQLTPKQLVEVLLDDQRQRWNGGDCVRAEEYFDRYSHLKADSQPAVDLIYGEYLLAAGTVGSCDQSTYLARFPEFRSELQRQFEVDSALSSDELAKSTQYEPSHLEETEDPFHTVREDHPGPLPIPAKPGALPTHIGRYEVTGLIGAGGMGQVYLARDPHVDRLVAIKVPRKELVDERGELAIEQFIGEARAAGKVDHPNVLEVYDADREGNQPYVVMKYVEGVGLDDWLKDRGGRTEDIDLAVDLACRVADGLQAVHQQDIVHRDVKPSNVLMDRGGQPKLMDFGVAYLQSQRGQMIQEVNIAGTWIYMSPEARQGRVEEVGTWSDVYSLGVMLFQMVTGRLPAQQRDHDKSSGGKPEWVTGHDVELDKILRRALDPQPESRYRTAEHFSDALREWVRSRRRLRDAWLTEEPAGEVDSNAWPDYVELLWILLMQPTRLYRQLRAQGIEDPGASMLRQWRTAGAARRPCREYVRRMLVLVCVVSPLLAFSAAAVLITARFWLAEGATAVAPAHGSEATPETSTESGASLETPGDTFRAVFILVATGIVTSTVFGLFRSPAWCAAWGIAWGVGSAILADNVDVVALSVFGVSPDSHQAALAGVFVGMALGISGGVCRSVGTRLAKGESENTINSVLIGMVAAIVFGVVFGVVASWLRKSFGQEEASNVGLVAGLSAGLALGLTSLIVVYRLPIYPLEAIWSAAIYGTQRLFGIPTLHLTPVLHHEISYFRYPFLASHLLLTDETDPQLVAVVLRACSDSPVQRQLAQEVRARLFCEKVELLVRARRFEELAHWLSAIAESHALSGLEALRDAARCLAALDAPEAHEQRPDRLRQAARHLDRLKTQLADDLSEWASEMRVLLASWVEVVQRLQRE